MTTTELCEAAGLSRSTVQQWLECGFLEAANVGIPGGGVRRVFARGQLERACLVKALLRKGVSLARLAASDLSFEAGQAYVVYGRPRTASISSRHPRPSSRHPGEPEGSQQ